MQDSYLVEFRKQIILSKMEGKSESERERAVRDINRMTFTDHADFMSYVDETIGTGEHKQTEATEEEIDAIMREVWPGYKPTLKSQDKDIDSDFDELFKSMGI